MPANSTGKSHTVVLVHRASEVGVGSVDMYSSALHWVMLVQVRSDVGVSRTLAYPLGVHTDRGTHMAYVPVVVVVVDVVVESDVLALLGVLAVLEVLGVLLSRPSSSSTVPMTKYSVAAHDSMQTVLVVEVQGAPRWPGAH